MPTSLDSIFFHWTLSSLLLSHRSGVRCQLPLSVVPHQLSSAPFSNQLSSRVPLPLPATPRFQVQKPFVWFRAKTDKGIICLAGHLYSVTEREKVIDLYIYIYIYIYIYSNKKNVYGWKGLKPKISPDYKFFDLAMDIIIRMFANDLKDRSLIPGQVIPKTQKWYLMLPFLILSILR